MPLTRTQVARIKAGTEPVPTGFVLSPDKTKLFTVKNREGFTFNPTTGRLRKMTIVEEYNQGLRLPPDGYVFNHGTGKLVKIGSRTFNTIQINQPAHTRALPKPTNTPYVPDFSSNVNSSALMSSLKEKLKTQQRSLVKRATQHNKTLESDGTFTYYPETSHNFKTPEDVYNFATNRKGVLFKNIIKTGVIKQSRKTIYKFQVNTELNQFYRPNFEEYLRLVYKSQTKAFKFNFAISAILERSGVLDENEKPTKIYLPYFAAEGRFKPFEYALEMIKNAKDVDRVAEALGPQMEVLFNMQPNSSTRMYAIIGLEFYVYTLDFALGAPVKLPEYIENLSDKTFVKLVKNRKTQKPYDDNLCLFRCVSLHQLLKVKELTKALNGLETLTKQNYQTYKEFVKSEYETKVKPLVVTGEIKVDMKQFELPEHNEFGGVDIEMLTYVEKCFNMAIYVYEVFECANTNHTTGLVRSSFATGEEMHLNLYLNHFSYIRDIDNFTSSYKCDKCDQLFNTRRNMIRHTLSCEEARQEVFIGGPFKVSENIYAMTNKLYENTRYYDYPIVFDFEAALIKKDREEEKLLNWDNVHIPISYSIYSKILDDQPELFANSYVKTLNGNRRCIFRAMNDPVKLMNQFVEDLKTLREPIINFVEKKFGRKTLVEVTKDDKTKTYINYEYLDTEKLTKAHFNVQKYINQVPVVGFNSGKYDINLIKQFLTHSIDKKNINVIKKASNYMSIMTEEFQFIDIINYIAPGYNLATLLAVYNAEILKMHFPYEWLDNFEKLQEQLPEDINVWGSSLKNTKGNQKDINEAMAIYKDYNCKTAMDYLEIYNNVDVVGLGDVLNKMMTQYAQLKTIDLFKDGVSISGIAEKILFRETKALLYMFMEEHKDIYHDVRSSMVGGPSIVFKRYAEKDKTTIRDSQNVCKKILGFDANALYLWCSMQHQMTGPYIVRHKDNNFAKGELYSEMSFEWLRYIEYKHKIKLQTAKDGGEYLINNYRVDGYDKDTKTIYEFLGCFYHGHNCSEKTHSKDKLNNTIARMEKFKKNYKVVSIWSCEWAAKKKQQDVKKFMKEYKAKIGEEVIQYEYYTEKDIIDLIMCDKMFGMVKCSGYTPDHLKEKFAEFPPFFKNTTIDCTLKDIVGEYAFNLNTEGLDEGKYHRKTTDSLISSYKFESMVMITPLIKWYIEHGLVIHNIEYVVQYVPDKCFENTCQWVVDTRRAGDKRQKETLKKTGVKIADIEAETAKLIGNSLYGKSIENVHNHNSVSFVGEQTIGRHIANRNFKDLEEFTICQDSVQSTTYEVSKHKNKIKVAKPIQFGFAVYCYAKLRMLQFYYDFLDVYIDRSKFELIQMDTDSMYMACSEENFDNLVKEEMTTQYQTEKYNWLVDDNLEGDSRTPGKFKAEFEGIGMIALCSKMYYCWDEKKAKYSCKGIQKSNNGHLLTYTAYMDALKCNTSDNATNKGIRYNQQDGTVQTYTQEKKGLSALYFKRKLLSDGVSTKPLDI